MASLVLYVIVLGWLYATYRIFVQLEGRLTIARLMFVGDAISGVFWILVILLALALRKDPFEALNITSESIFFLFQLAMLLYYMGSVIVRVIVLAAQLTLRSLVELVAIVIVGHHYYISVWVPSVIGEIVRGNLGPYAAYAVLYFFFAYTRISTFPALEEALVHSRIGSIFGLRYREKRLREPRMPL